LDIFGSVIQADNGTEFKGGFGDLMGEFDLKLIHGKSYTSTHNGAIERFQQTLRTAIGSNLITILLRRSNERILEHAPYHTPTNINPLKAWMWAVQPHSILLPNAAPLGPTPARSTIKMTGSSSVASADTSFC
jgi:hypothetical protein